MVLASYGQLMAVFGDQTRTVSCLSYIQSDQQGPQSLSSAFAATAQGLWDS